MAKKKTTETSAEAKPAKAAPKKAPAKKAAAPAQQFGAPLVDTNLAAENAAKLLVAGLKKPTAQGTSPSSKLFQQIKTGPSNSSIIGNIVGKTGDQSKKSGSPVFGSNQKGHNQTFGSDASKAFVPRRTSGG